MGTVTAECPASYDQLWRWYGNYIRHLVSKNDIPEHSVDDVAQDILAALIKNDIIAQFEPDKTVEHGGKQVRCTFRNFLSHKVYLYCRGKRDSLMRRASREVLSIDADPDGDGSWAESLGAVWDDYSALDEQEFVTRMREYLAAQPVPEGGCSLLAVFDELVREVRETGEAQPAELRERFGISGAEASAWVARLAEIMSSAPARPAQAAPRELYGVRLSPADIRSAIDILEASGGTRVARPLEQAGHPLANAEAGWYHPFSKAELKQFPEIRLKPKAGKRGELGHGHVKAAVIHGLYRMLGIWAAETPAPAEEAPEAEPGPRDFLEQKLFLHKLPPGVVDECLALADEMAAVA